MAAGGAAAELEARMIDEVTLHVQRQENELKRLRILHAQKVSDQRKAELLGPQSPSLDNNIRDPAEQDRDVGNALPPTRPVVNPFALPGFGTFGGDEDGEGLESDSEDEEDAQLFGGGRARARRGSVWTQKGAMRMACEERTLLAETELKNLQAEKVKLENSMESLREQLRRAQKIENDLRPLAAHERRRRDVLAKLEGAPAGGASTSSSSGGAAAGGAGRPRGAGLATFGLAFTVIVTGADAGPTSPSAQDALPGRELLLKQVAESVAAVFRGKIDDFFVSADGDQWVHVVLRLLDETDQASTFPAFYRNLRGSEALEAQVASVVAASRRGGSPSSHKARTAETDDHEVLVSPLRVVNFVDTYATEEDHDGTIAASLGLLLAGAPPGSVRVVGANPAESKMCWAARVLGKIVGSAGITTAGAGPEEAPQQSTSSSTPFLYLLAIGGDPGEENAKLPLTQTAFMTRTQLARAVSVKRSSAMTSGGEMRLLFVHDAGRRRTNLDIGKAMTRVLGKKGRTDREDGVTTSTAEALQGMLCWSLEDIFELEEEILESRALFRLNPLQNRANAQAKFREVRSVSPLDELYDDVLNFQRSREMHGRGGGPDEVGMQVEQAEVEDLSTILPLYEPQVKKLFHVICNGVPAQNTTPTAIAQLLATSTAQKADSQFSFTNRIFGQLSDFGDADLDADGGGGTKGMEIDASSSPESRRCIAFESEFLPLVRHLLQEAGVGEPLCEKRAQITYGVLREYFQAGDHASAEQARGSKTEGQKTSNKKNLLYDFASQLRAFSLRSLKECAAPPLQVVTRSYRRRLDN